MRIRTHTQVSTHTYARQTLHNLFQRNKHVCSCSVSVQGLSLSVDLFWNQSPTWFTNIFLSTVSTWCYNLKAATGIYYCLAVWPRCLHHILLLPLILWCTESIHSSSLMFSLLSRFRREFSWVFLTNFISVVWIFYSFLSEGLCLISVYFLVFVCDYRCFRIFQLFIGIDIMIARDGNS